MTKKYIIHDIAELSGVSIGAVDRVLHKRGKVLEIALKKVNKILDEINYIPNPIAKKLKNNKVFRICALIPDPKKDAYWSPCIESINDVISEFNMSNPNLFILFGSKFRHYFFDIHNHRYLFKSFACSLLFRLILRWKTCLYTPNK